MTLFFRCPFTMKKNINRRVFIKNSAIAGTVGLMAQQPIAGMISSDAESEKAASQWPECTFNSNGKFKILQLNSSMRR
jgi:hypothetical protein